MSERLNPHDWRAGFPIVNDTTYLVNHSLGAMPVGVREKLAGFADKWAERGVRAWSEGWWTAPTDVGNLVGKLMNAPEDSVVMHQNVSVIQSVVASAIDFSGARNKVVYTDQNFPTVGYVWEAQRARGARIEVVPSDGVRVPTERMLEAIDEETAIVPISHVCYQTCFLQDAAAICARAREVGALVLLDCYQSLGTVPVDVQALGVDMVCGGSVKWLCGGPGAGYLYVRPDLQEELEPTITGWMAHAEPFAFETGAQRYTKSMERFLHGSPAVASLLHASAGYEAVLEVGVERIREYSLQLTRDLREDLTERGFTINSPDGDHERGGTLAVGLAEEEDGKAFVQALAARDVLVDHRPEMGLRVSPHFYTTAEELSAFAEHMSELRSSGSWQAHQNEASAY